MNPTGSDASSENTYDVAVVGGGIVGLSTALALANRFPERKIVVLEKERRVAAHQTGHNSGVVHSGVYYVPGSLKAQLTRRGNHLLKAFCADNGVPYDECGKVIVATKEAELPWLRKLHERGVENGVPGVRLIDGDELRRIEPHAAGIMAVHCPETAIVDYATVCERLAEQLHARGVRVQTEAEVRRISSGSHGLHIEGPGFALRSRYLVNCAGLHSDRIARLAGLEPEVNIVPFRGEYYMLRPSSQELVRGLIYPVPDPRFPFLGVHFTKTIQGGVEAGPNAVLALAREGYRWRNLRLADLAELASFSGFWRLARRYWTVGVFEVYRSLSKGAFVKSLRKLVPSITSSDITPGPSGVRAQAVGADGKLVDDFVIQESPFGLHVLNAPSPAATAGLAIGEYIANRVQLT